jgi:hypothetical protein
VNTESIPPIQTSSPTPATRAPGAAPDWQILVNDVTCPMCDYNLRGLSDPVCPECGYRFEWADVTNPARRLHPYLFEHHPERNLRSFAQTLLNHLHPVGFWRLVNPAQPSRPGRIVIYWALYAAATLLPAAMGIIAWLRYQTLFLRLRGIPAQPFSLFRQPWAHDAFVRMLLIACVIWAVYPWLSFLTLMVFRQSMRRVRVKTSHVLRCALYCGDVMFWNALWAAGVIAWYVVQGQLRRTHDLAALLIAGTLVAGALNVTRLAIAYRLYMRFDRALATVITSQTIVVLGLLAALIYLL